MAHRISAVLLSGPFDDVAARSLGLKPIPLPQGITLFPLEAELCDAWSEQLGIHGFVSERPILNCQVVHHLMRKIAAEPIFAVIETEYFGGQGEQAAAVYRGGEVLMAPAVAETGPINVALRHLGVHAVQGKDEFDTVGLGSFRSFDDLD
jgi:hypothetical protein